MEVVLCEWHNGDEFVLFRFLFFFGMDFSI